MGKIICINKTIKMEKTKISAEEQKVLDSFREQKDAREKCAKEINKLCVKYKCKIVVNPNSLIKDPQITVMND